jgi:pilus assembly protein CpaC
MGGEIKVTEQIERSVLAIWQGSSRITPRRLLATLAASVVAVTAIIAVPATDAQAERLIQISGAKRTVSVTIAVGKTEDVHVDAPFSDITVGDPEVADVAPLTDQTLSILGKKIGTTRVTVYADGKRQLGIFDIEVSYDVSRLASEIRSVVGPGIRVSSVNGRIMLSGSAPDAATLDKAVVIARQFAPEIINTVRVASPQQVMLEVRFVEASRQAGRELGVQWNVFNSRLTSNIGSRRTPGLLPITAPTSATNIPAGEVAAGLRRVAVRFHLVDSRSGTTIDVMTARLAARNLAEPNLTALSGDTASFGGRQFPSGHQQRDAVEFKRMASALPLRPPW